MRKTIKTATAAFLMIGPAAQAASLPLPTASYDATAAVDAGSSHFTATINAAGPKERVTTQVNQIDQTVLVDLSTGSAQLLIPALNAAMPIDSRATGGLNLAQLNTLPVTVEGQETILGLPATRYGVKGDSRQGSFNGHVWETASGILLKVTGNAVHAGETTPVNAVLTSVQLRPQDPALFQLPPGMKRLPVGLNGLMKGAK